MCVLVFVCVFARERGREKKKAKSVFDTPGGT